MNAKEIMHILNNTSHDYYLYIDKVVREKGSRIYNAYYDDSIVYKIYENMVYYIDYNYNREIFIMSLNDEDEFSIVSLVKKSDSFEENVKNQYYDMPFYKLPDSYDIPEKPDASDIENAEDARKFAKDYEEYEQKVKDYKNKVNLYNMNMMKLREEFREDIKKEFSLENNPKEELLYELSCDYSDKSFLSIFNNYKNFYKLMA